MKVNYDKLKMYIANPRTTTKNEGIAKKPIVSKEWEDTDWKKILVKHLSDNGLLSKIYKELCKPNNKKLIWFKNGQAWTDISLKKTSRWQICIWKDGLHHVIRKMQVKTVRYHYTPLRTTQVQKSRTLTTPNSGEDVEQ